MKSKHFDRDNINISPLSIIFNKMDEKKRPADVYLKSLADFLPEDFFRRMNAQEKLTYIRNNLNNKSFIDIMYLQWSCSCVFLTHIGHELKETELFHDLMVLRALRKAIIPEDKINTLPILLQQKITVRLRDECLTYFNISHLPYLDSNYSSNQAGESAKDKAMQYFKIRYPDIEDQVQRENAPTSVTRPSLRQWPYTYPVAIALCAMVVTATAVFHQNKPA